MKEPGYPSLVRDGLEWEEFPGERTTALVIPVDASQLQDVDIVRKVVGELPVLLHPDHYLHITLRQFPPSQELDHETINAIRAKIASVPAWSAPVRGVRAFPTAIWADPDGDGRLRAVASDLLGEIGTLPTDPHRERMIAHITLAYTIGAASAADVRAHLAPLRDHDMGSITIDEAILAELVLVEPYPHWRVCERFPFGA